MGQDFLEIQYDSDLNTNLLESGTQFKGQNVFYFRGGLVCYTACLQSWSQEDLSPYCQSHLVIRSWTMIGSLFILCTALPRTFVVFCECSLAYSLMNGSVKNLNPIHQKSRFCPISLFKAYVHNSTYIYMIHLNIYVLYRWQFWYWYGSWI